MSYVETDHAQPARHNPELHAIAIRELRALGAGHVLDLPSGPGYLVRDLQALGFTGVAGEIVTSLHCFDDVSYAEVDMTRRFPFDNASFDYVVSIEGIEHIADPFAFMGEVRRVLRPGGRLLLTTPNVGSLESRWRFFLSGFHQMEAGPIPLDTPNIHFEHINPMTLSQLFFVCERSDLRIERVLTSRHRRGARLLRLLTGPLVAAYVRHECRRHRDTAVRRAAMSRLEALLLSPANLLGVHTIVVAQAQD
ncbi:MAG: class I SAM-dependent methyltransferase [bacterium]|nr:class I SAM-dependent methyltransferase [bacterium]